MATRGRYANRYLAAYGLPALPLAAIMMPVYIFLPTFYAQSLGIGMASVGIVRLIAGIWDVVTDPLVGVFGDRTHTRYGRRKVWIAAGLPVTMLGTWMLLVPPGDAGALHMLIWSAVMYLGWTAMILPLSAWGAELSSDYDERSRIAAWREGFVVAGTLITLALVAMLGFDAQGAQGKALQTIALFVCIALPLATLVCLYVVPEPAALKGKPMHWQESWQVLARNRPFRRLISAYLINGLANGLPATLIVYFVDYVLREQGNVGPYLFAYFLCGVIAIPIWVRASNTFGKHRTWCAAMIWACVIFAAVPFVGAGDSTLYMAICILTGLGFGADLALPASMQADVVDRDTLATGQQRTGLYFALWGMATKLSLALAAGIGFPVLAFTGFDPPQATATWPLVMLYAIVPIVFKLIAIAIMWRHPLDRAAVEDIRQQIRQKYDSP